MSGGSVATRPRATLNPTRHKLF